jgi:starch synthase
MVLDESMPLFVCITRLVYQKGPRLIVAAIRYALERGCACILLGSPPEPAYEHDFERLRDDYAEDPLLHLHFNYNEQLAHQLYAAGNFFLIPSIFEPCGLTQLISFRYGTLPLARKTGGLTDSIQHEKTGLLFEEPSRASLCDAVDRAIEIYQDLPKYQQMITNAMSEDFSWRTSTKKYIELYKKIS